VLAYNTPLLPRNPATAVQSGQVLHVPVLSSGSHDEERAFAGGAQKVKPFFTAKTYLRRRVRRSERPRRQQRRHQDLQGPPA
jgi:hypothetical protein